MAFQNLGGDLRYWRTPSGSEVDFIWTRGKRAVGVEVKASPTWRHDFGGPLNSAASGRSRRAGGLRRLHGDGRIERRSLGRLPLQRFFKELTSGRVLGLDLNSPRRISQARPARRASCRTRRAAQACDGSLRYGGAPARRRARDV